MSKVEPPSEYVKKKADSQGASQPQSKNTLKI